MDTSPVDPVLPPIPVFDVGADYPVELARLVGERGYELLAVATKGVPPSPSCSIAPPPQS